MKFIQIGPSSRLYVRLNSSIGQLYGREDGEKCISETTKTVYYEQPIYLYTGGRFAKYHRSYECKVCGGYVYSQHKININEQTSDIIDNMLSIDMYILLTISL